MSIKGIMVSSWWGCCEAESVHFEHMAPCLLSTQGWFSVRVAPTHLKSNPSSNGIRSFTRLCSHWHLHFVSREAHYSFPGVTGLWLISKPLHVPLLPSCLPCLSSFKTSVRSFLGKSHPICHSNHRQICFERDNLGSKDFLFSDTSIFYSTLCLWSW